MKAFQLVDWRRPPELRDVPVPDPGPGAVLIRVGGAGACHSDLHVLEYAPGARPWTPPFTLGHENAGWVEALGPGVTGLSAGDAVAVYGPWGCGRCRACRASRDNYCERRGELGMLGGDTTVALAAACVRAEGEAIVVGAAGGPFSWRFGALAPGAALSTTLWGTATNLVEVLELARAGQIGAHAERFALERAADAYERLRAGDLGGRAVIVP